MKLIKLFTLHLTLFVLAVLLAWIAPQHEQQNLANVATFLGLTITIVWGFAAMCHFGTTKPVRQW